MWLSASHLTFLQLNGSSQNRKSRYFYGHMSSPDASCVMWNFFIQNWNNFRIGINHINIGILVHFSNLLLTTLKNSYFYIKEVQFIAVVLFYFFKYAIIFFPPREYITKLEMLFLWLTNKMENPTMLRSGVSSRTSTVRRAQRWHGSFPLFLAPGTNLTLHPTS